MAYFPTKTTNNLKTFPDYGAYTLECGRARHEARKPDTGDFEKWAAKLFAPMIAIGGTPTEAVLELAHA